MFMLFADHFSFLVSILKSLFKKIFEPLNQDFSKNNCLKVWYLLVLSAILERRRNSTHSIQSFLKSCVPYGLHKFQNYGLHFVNNVRLIFESVHIKVSFIGILNSFVIFCFKHDAIRAACSASWFCKWILT